MGIQKHCRLGLFPAKSRPRPLPMIALATLRESLFDCSAVTGCHPVGIEPLRKM